jgi:hypothetical protein
VPEPVRDLVQPFEHLKTRHVRHVDVAQHQVRSALDDFGKLIRPAVGDDRLEAPFSEHLGNQRNGFAIVFDAEDLFARIRHRTLRSELSTTRWRGVNCDKYQNYSS